MVSGVSLTVALIEVEARSDRIHGPHYKMHSL